MSGQVRWRTVLIESENLIRTLLARFLLFNGQFSLLADFGEVGPAWEACLRLRPQLVVIDVDFAPEESMALVEVLTTEHPQTRVLAMSGSNDPVLLHRLYRANVHGYVPRNESIELLEEAMNEVAEGRTYFPAAFLKNQEQFAEDQQQLSILLSEQEQEILRLVAAGQTSREIAETIRLSPRSVETYRLRLMRKLKLPNAAALVEFAFRNGISKPRQAENSRVSEA